jgi:hypothetical protein
MLSSRQLILHLILAARVPGRTTFFKVLDHVGSVAAARLTANRLRKAGITAYHGSYNRAEPESCPRLQLSYGHVIGYSRDLYVNTISMQSMMSTTLVCYVMSAVCIHHTREALSHEICNIQPSK